MHVPLTRNAQMSDRLVEVQRSNDRLKIATLVLRCS